VKSTELKFQLLRFVVLVLSKNKIENDIPCSECINCVLLHAFQLLIAKVSDMDAPLTSQQIDNFINKVHNNNNNNRISIAPYGRNFRGAENNYLVTAVAF